MTNSEYAYEMTETLRGIIKSDLFSADEKMEQIHKMAQGVAEHVSKTEKCLTNLKTYLTKP